MLIKYFFQVGHQFQNDPMSGMVIPDIKQFQFFKSGIFSLLEKDKVNVDKIESLKYWNKFHEGWVEVSDKTFLDFREEDVKELNLLIKLNEDFPCVATDLQLHFNTLINRVKSLETRLKELDNRIKNPSGSLLYHQHSNQLLSTPSLNDLVDLTRNVSMYPPSVNSFEESRLDIAFLYSNPLVKEVDRGKLLPLNEPIDFESEINCLVDIFQNSEKKITARFEVANLDNISEIIRKKPKILHISSHGSYGVNKEGESKFYLNFEDQQGKLDQFDAERLSNLLKSSLDDKSQIEVVFVSACHSEAVANVFREAKVPAVVCVHSANEVLDEAAQKFAKIFYECLLDGKDLKYSFEQARRVVSSGIDKTVNTCCCTHIHTPECRWQEKATKDCEEAHQLHIKRCNCNYKESHMHVNNCSWALNLQGSYNVESIIEGNFIKICCCSPEVAHNESNKFILKVDNNFENESIFAALPSGNLEIKNKNCCLNINFTVDMKTSLIGRNIELYNVISILSAKNCNHKRLVTVYGTDGVGKNSFVKLAGKYMFERKFFQDGLIYINTRGHVFTETWLISKIIANLDLDNVIDDIMHFCNLIKQLRILIIVNFSKQQEDSAVEIKKTIKTILDHTRTPKILVTMDKPLNIDPYENKTKLEPLSDFYSAKLLMTLANNYLPKVIKNDILKIAKHEYIQISQGIPSKIYHIAGLLQEHKTFEALVDKIKKEDLKKQALSDQLVEILLDNMSKNSALIYEILFLLSALPNGVLEEELVEIYKRYNNYLEIFDIVEHISHNTIVLIKSVNKEIGTSYSMAYDLIPSINSLNIDHQIKLKCYRDLVRYYAKLMRNLVSNLYDNQESPIEFSAAQNYGMWLSTNKNICVLPSKFEKIKSPLKRYFFNETNILSMLKVDNIYLKELLEKGNEEFIESIEQLSICMPTVLKLGKKMTECLTVLNFFLKICEEYHLSLAQARLYLFKASLHVLYNNHNHNSFNYRNNIYSDCPKSTNIFANLIDAKKNFELKNFEEGDAETSFVKGVILYEIESSKTRYSFERIAKDIFEEIMKELDRSIKIYRRIQLSVGLARVCYIMAQYSINNRQYEESALKYFKEALLIFEKNNNKIMQIKCLQGIGLWYLGIENLVASKDFLEQAKIIADKLKTSNSEVIKYELNKQITEILDHSRARSHNVFVFIKAFQLVKFDNNTNSNTEFNYSRSKSVERFLSSTYKEIEYPVDPLIIHYSTFRDRIKEKFNKTRKELTIKFDFLTEKNLKEVFSRVGRVLHISSDDFNSKGSLMVEGDNGESYELTPEHLRHIISKTKCLYDLVILAIPQSENLAKIFIEAGIRHVICFKFNHSFLKKSESLTSISFYNIIHEFTVYLLNSVILEQSIEDAYNNAVREFNKQIANVRQHLFNFYLNKDVISEINGEDNKSIAEVILLPAESNHKVKLYGKSVDFENEETILVDGKLHDASKIRARLFNITKRNHAIIGRKKEIYNAAKMMKMINMFNIYGDSGCGKTLLSKEICYYLYTRNYFKEGIFYFDLFEVRNVEKIKALFHEASVASAIEETKKLKGDGINPNEERKILIVFDNVDKMLKYTENQFFLFLKSFNKERIFIHYVFISNKEILNDNIIESIEILPLPVQEASYLFLYYLHRTIDRKEIDIDNNEIEMAGDYKILIEKITDLSELVGLSTRLRACRGMPKYIKKLAELATTKHLNSISWKELNLSRKLKITNNSEQDNSYNSANKKEVNKESNVNNMKQSKNYFNEEIQKSLNSYDIQTPLKNNESESRDFVLNIQKHNDNFTNDEKEKDLGTEINHSKNYSKNENEQFDRNEKYVRSSINYSTGQGMQNMNSNQLNNALISNRASEDDYNSRSQIESSINMMNNSFIRSSIQSTNTLTMSQNIPQNINNSENFFSKENLQQNSVRNSLNTFNISNKIQNINNIAAQNKNRVSFGRASFTVGSSLSNTNSIYNNLYSMSNMINTTGIKDNQIGVNYNNNINNCNMLRNNQNNNTIGSLNSSIIIDENYSNLSCNAMKNSNNDKRNSISSNATIININPKNRKKKQSYIAEEEAEEELEHKFSQDGDDNDNNMEEYIGCSNLIQSLNTEEMNNSYTTSSNDDGSTPDEEDPFINNLTISPRIKNSKLKNKVSNISEFSLNTNKDNNLNYIKKIIDPKSITTNNLCKDNPTFCKNFFKSNDNKTATKCENVSDNYNSSNNIIGQNYINNNYRARKESSSSSKKKSKIANSLVIKNIYMPEGYSINTNQIVRDNSLNSLNVNINIQQPILQGNSNFNNSFINTITKSPFDYNKHININPQEESSSNSNEEDEEKQEKGSPSKNSVDRKSSQLTLSNSQRGSASQTDSNFNSNQQRKKKKKGVKSGKMSNKYKPKNNNKYHENFKKNKTKKEEDDKE